MSVGPHVHVGEDEIFYSGTTSGPDGGTETFCIIFSGERPLYGAWKELFSSEYIASIRIISFGYRNRQNVGNPIAAARDHISDARAAAATILIERLFETLSREKDIIPFCIDGVSYDHRLLYDKGWLI